MLWTVSSIALDSSYDLRIYGTCTTSGSLKLKEVIISTLAILDSYKSDKISHVEWKMLKEVCEVLKIFYKKNVEISAENMTLSKVFFLVQ